MENEKWFIMLSHTTDLSRFGCSYESFIMRFNNLSKIEKTEVVRLLKTDKRPGRYNEMYRQILIGSPFWEKGESILAPDEKEKYQKYLQWLKKQKRKKEIKDWAILSPIIIIVAVIGWPILKFVGGICFVGFDLFASEGSVLGYIFGIAAVIITLGMFATLVKAILGR